MLFFPRTALLGALLSIGVMGQICALNFCYDVPVKILSLHLLAMAMFLAAEDTDRLAGMFLLNRPVMPARDLRVIHRKHWRQGAELLKVIALTCFAITSIYTARSWHSQLKKRDAMPTQAPLLNRGFHWTNEWPYNR